MDKKNQLLINNNFADAFFGLSDDNAGKLIKALFTYHLSKEVKKNNDIVDFALNCMIPVLKNNDESFIKKCNKNKENAEMRWNANACERIKNNANDANRIEYNRIEYNKKENIYTKEFEDWYLEYPRHDSKIAAFKSFVKSLKLTTFSKLLESAKSYKAQCLKNKTEEKYIKMPSTWLNQGCWDNENYEIKKPLAKGGWYDKPVDLSFKEENKDDKNS